MRKHFSIWPRSALARYLAFGADAAGSRPLASWNDGPAKQAIVEFVTTLRRRVGRVSFRWKNASSFSTKTARYGTSGLYVQLTFMLEQAEAAVPRHPEWKTSNPSSSKSGITR